MHQIVGILLIAAVFIVFVAAVNNSPEFAKKLRLDETFKASRGRQAGTPTPSAPPTIRQAENPPSRSPSSTPQPTPTPIPPRPRINPSDIPGGFSERDLSPYFRKVRITRATPAGGYYGEIRLSANLDRSETMDITGWKIRSNTDFFVVPKAVVWYDPALANLPENIVIGPDHEVRFFTHRNTIDINYRLNICMGYFRGHSPDLPRDCPRPERNELTNLSGRCQDYVSGLGSCELPSASPPIAYDDAACVAILNRLNYTNCYETSRPKPNFLKNEWRIWLGNFSRASYNILDSRHDKVSLFDRAGLLVDQYVY